MKCQFALTCLLFLSLFSTAFAGGKDTAKITGKVLDDKSQPVSYANVLLFATADSALVKVEYSKDDGSFELASVPVGNYWLSITYVGLPDYVSQTFQVAAGETKTLGTISLKAASVDLTEVTVTAKKPLVEVHPDKTVFNVEGSINATGSDAMELLRKAPGVVVDNNDNVMMNGKNGVKIYINGKPSHLSTEDLAAYLRTLQASDIATIEIISNPSARFEAEGNAGIINIRMKKDQRLGANGNVNLGYSVGQRQNFSGALSGNYRSKGMNTFGSYSYNAGEDYNFFDLYREQVGTTFDQRSTSGGDNGSHNFKLGSDFFINEFNTVGFLVNGYESDYSQDSRSKTFIHPIGQTVADSSLIAGTENDGMRSNYNFNLNYRFDNTKGVVWNLDADYGFFKNESDQYQPNVYRMGDGGEGTSILNEKNYRTNAPTNIDIYTAKIDHERPLLGGQLGVGAKFSFVTTDNDFKFYNVVENNDILDPDRTNHFVYDENVNAAYLNYSRQMGKFGVQAGLRAEQTVSEGDLTALKPINNQNVKRDYLGLFPSGGLTWQANPVNVLQFTYSRRIDRPSYQDLNPFEGRLDELTFQKGNPFLNPQYSNNFQLNHTYKYMYNTSLSYSRTTDLMTQLTFIDDRDSNAGFITQKNLGRQTNLSLTFSAPVQIAKWWNAYVNATGYRTYNFGNFADTVGVGSEQTIRNYDVELTIWAYNFYAQNTFNLPKGIALEVSGWYNSPSVWGGTFKNERMFSIDAGLQKKFMQDKLTVKLSVSDIFKTTNWNSESFFGPLYIRGKGGWDSRRFRVNVNYAFGNQQVKSARRRSTGLEDEKNRIKSGN